jgi:hypothetical protein
LIAAILVNLSVYIVALMVDVTNILGGGIGKLLTAPFGDANQFQFSPNVSQSIILGGGSILSFIGGTIFVVGFVGIGAAASFLALFVLLPAVVGIIGAFLTMVIRQGVILALILVSPVAFALYCLPNTEKYFKKWWETLIKTLMVYPLVIVMFAVADILAVTIQKANGFGDKPLLTQVPGNAIAGIVAFVAMFLPLVLIPWAFKMAGGIVGNVVGAIGNFGKKGVEAIKGNANDPNSLRNKVRRQVLENATERQGALAHRGRDVLPGDIADALARGDHKEARKLRRQRAIGRVMDNPLLGNLDDRLSYYNKLAMERRARLSDTGRDDLVFAGAGYEAKAGERYSYIDKDTGEFMENVENKTGHSVFIDSKGREISQNRYRRGKALYGGNVGAVGQGLGYTLGKAQNDAHRAMVRTALQRNAKAEKWDQTMVNDAWAAATYPLKGSQATEWYSKPTLNDDGSVTYKDVRNDDKTFNEWLGDVHQTRKGFELSQMTDGDWRMLRDRQQQLEHQVGSMPPGAERDAAGRQLARIYEVFDAASSKLAGFGGEPGTAEAGTPLGRAESITAAGATAAAKPHIEAAVRQRRYQMSDSLPDGERALIATPTGGAAGPPGIVWQGLTGGDLDRSSVPSKVR